MKMMNEAQTTTEHTKKCKEWKAKKAPTRDEINEMVAESVKKSVKEIFETHVKSLPDLLDPENDFFWSNNLYKTEALQEASTHLQSKVRNGGPQCSCTDMQTSHRR